MSAEIHSLLGAYVLDAIDDIERAAFERHLGECAECRAEVDELREAAARLADGAWSVPPPSLRGDVMAAIHTTRQLPPAPAGRIRRPTLTGWRRLTAAAAAVLAVGGATFAAQESRVRREHVRAEAARADEARIRAVLAAPDLAVREQAVAGGGRVTVAVSRLHNAGVIVFSATAPPTARVYQLWTVRSGTPHSEGVLATGQAAALRIVEGIGQASDVGVTVEPVGGSDMPTQPMVADLKLV